MFQSLRISLVKKIIDINEHFIFEKRLRKIYDSIPGDSIKTVIDVGANKGQSIAFFKKLNKECVVFSFEPNKKLYELLLAKYKRDSNVSIYNVGISDKIGDADFHENVLDYTSSFETLNPDSVYLRKKAQILGVSTEGIVTSTYSVATTTLAHFINTQVGTTVDILKLDVEGHEYPCLVGLFSEKLGVKIRYIQVENHNDDMYSGKYSFADITELLKANGFDVKYVVKHGFSNLEEVVFGSDAS